MNKQIDAAALKKYIDGLLAEIGGRTAYERGAKKALRLVRDAIVTMQKAQS
jgi:hypothetical protein